MTFNLTVTQAWFLFGATCVTILVHVVSTTWIAVQARRAWNDSQDRKRLEARALELVAHAKANREPRTTTNEKGQHYRVDIQERTYELGVDRFTDRAALLAKEWGAVTLRWSSGNYEVRLRTLNDPPEGN